MSIFVKSVLSAFSAQQFAQEITFRYLDLNAKFNALEATLKAEYEAKLTQALAADQIQDEQILAETVQEKVSEVSAVFQSELDRISAESATKAEAEKAKADADKATQSDLIAKLAEAGLVTDDLV